MGQRRVDRAGPTQCVPRGADSISLQAILCSVQCELLRGADPATQDHAGLEPWLFQHRSQPLYNVFSLKLQYFKVYAFDVARLKINLLPCLNC